MGVILNQGTGSRRTVKVKETSSKAMVAIDGAGFDWSFMTDEKVPTKMALMAFSDLEIEKLKKEKESNQIKINKFENASKSLDKLIGSQIFDNSRKGMGFVSYNVVPPPPTGLFAPPTIDLSNSGLEEFQQPKFEGYGPNTSKSVCKDTSNEAHAIYHQNGMDGKWESIYTRANQVNVVKASACWVWRPTKLNNASISFKRQNYIDARGRSKHMTGNMSYLTNFKEFDGGNVTFRGGANEERIIVRNFLINVLFTNTTCFVLSPDFKLPNESQVLLKVLRKNNMYNVDMKNIVPKESLTCLVANATLDESMLWHRRLGHINFKTINKLVKDNLVRGLPAKHFENDQIYVACLKGKQHKASCKSKIQNSITQPVFMLHMNLFGPTFMSNLMNKKYCLVVTDDYSRFTWVFFLASKDETSGILKNLHIRFLENKPIVTGDGLNNAEKKDDEGVSKASGFSNQEQPERSTPNINTARPSANFKTGSLNINIVSPKVITTRSNRSQNESDMFSLGRSATLKATHADLFGDEREMDMSNLLTYIKGMTKNTNEHGFISAVYEGKTHEDLHTCLFACFLSQGKNKKNYQSLSDPAWVDRSNAGELLSENYKRGGICVQPPGFEDVDYPDKVYKVVKALYGLHQAPRAWTASTPMDIEKPLLKDSNGDDVDVHLYRLMIGSLMYLTSSRPNIMFALCACSRFQVTPKVSHLHAVKMIFSDYVGASLDRKSTTGGCQFLGCRLISWQCKKQIVVATSSTEAEYVVAASCCGQSRMDGRTCNIKQKYVMNQIPRKLKRGRDIKIPQSSGPPKKVGDEAVHKELGDRIERAATTASSLEAVAGRVSLNELRESKIGQEKNGKIKSIERINTNENGEMEITATIDGRVKTVTEASIRRHLKLEDSDGISTLPNTEIFEQLALMGVKDQQSKVTP
ncbi:putative ribonuclease H-like domain-containing protein [Tanacetum coccineum]